MAISCHEFRSGGLICHEVMSIVNDFPMAISTPLLDAFVLGPSGGRQCWYKEFMDMERQRHTGTV